MLKSPWSRIIWHIAKLSVPLVQILFFFINMAHWHPWMGGLLSNLAIKRATLNQMIVLFENSIPEPVLSLEFPQNWFDSYDVNSFFIWSIGPSDKRKRFSINLGLIETIIYEMPTERIMRKNLAKSFLMKRGNILKLLTNRFMTFVC